MELNILSLEGLNVKLRPIGYNKTIYPKIFKATITKVGNNFVFYKIQDVSLKHPYKNNFIKTHEDGSGFVVYKTKSEIEDYYCHQALQEPICEFFKSQINVDILSSSDLQRIASIIDLPFIK